MLGSDISRMDRLPCFKDFIAVLFECFFIITLGYLSARFKLISNQAKDLNSYLTTFALPMIIFLNIAQMDFQTINLSFLICMLIAKLFVFITVTLLTLAISYPKNFGYAGSLSILATQSNDFALGYPLIKSLHGDTKPEMLTYLSLMAPIQLLILNPLGIAMLEYNKSRKFEKKTDEFQASPVCNQCNLIKPTSPVNKVHTRPEQQFDAPKWMPANTTQPNCNQTPPSATDAISIENKYSGTLHQSISLSPTNSELSRPINESNPYARTDTEIAQMQGFNRKNTKMLTISMATVESDSKQSLSDLREVTHMNQPAYCSSTLPNSHPRYGLSALANGMSISPASIPGTRILYRHRPSKGARPRGKRSVSPIEPAPKCSCPIVDDESGNNRGSTLNLNFLKALATNPLIIASTFALIVNLVHGPELPKLVTRVSNTIAASFASPALFIVGVSMYGKFELLLRNPNDLLLSSVLALTKVLILPNLMRTFALFVLPKFTPPEELPYLVDFSFLYGLLPTAPTACIIANQYGVLTNVVSISMLLSTFISAPMLIAAAVIISPASTIKAIDLENTIAQTMKVTSLITLVLAPITLYGFWRTKKSLRYTDFVDVQERTARTMARIKKISPIQIFLLLLAMSQTLIGLGGLTSCFLDANNKTDSKYHPQFSHSFMMRNETISSTLEPFDEEPEAVTISLPASLPFPSLLPEPDPTPLIRPLETLAGPFQLNLGHTTLNMLQYVMSSSGLVMSRFVILCMIITMVATRFKDLATALKVSSLMVKLYAILGVAVVTVLSLESNVQRYSPVEPILPDLVYSLGLRLIYNVIFLALSIPLYALIIRCDNKNKHIFLASQVGLNVETTDGDSATNYISGPFLASSASISSDSSSAVTINTNLELSSSTAHSAAQAPQLAPSTNNLMQPNQVSDQLLTILIDTGPLDAVRRPFSTTEPQTYGSYDASAAVEPCLVGLPDNNNQSSHYEPIEGSNHVEKHVKAGCLDGFCAAEFNKYSVLIVFMLIDSVLNLTSITQKLLQEQPIGTFRQIEVINVAMAFGQGLITFLIYRTRGMLH